VCCIGRILAPGAHGNDGPGGFARELSLSSSGGHAKHPGAMPFRHRRARQKAAAACAGWHMSCTCQGMNSTVNTVPVIDLAGTRPLEGQVMDPGARERAARAIDQACRDIGFLIIDGHGVDPAVTAAAFEAAFGFFDAPDAVKLSAVPPDGRVRGYTPMHRQALARSLEQDTPPDLFERFRMGAFDLPDDDYHRQRVAGWFAPNVWPTARPDLRVALERYYRAMEDLAADLMRLFALALHLPEAYFQDKIDRHISSLCVNHYPAPCGPPLPEQWRAGAHTDYGSLTIVAPTVAPGCLQVRRRDGAWLEVQPQPGQFIVNIGDLMAQWTNDRWVSTLHRVGNPPPGSEASSRRLSLVFFHQPNDDAMVACLPSSLAAGEQPRYAPITSGEHLRLKITRQFVAPGATPAEAPPQDA